MTTTSPTELLHVDGYLLVANKPAGLLSVPGRGRDKQDCLSVRIQNLYPDALIVHRLDMATSGLIVFARGTEMQRRLSAMFARREIEKRYIAIADGRFEPNAGEISLPIAADWPRRPLRKVDFAHGKQSATRYRVIEEIGNDSEGAYSRVELVPITGRTHQLRLHLAAIGHPIIGDSLYGDATGAPRLMLHASTLEFAHPDSMTPMHLYCDPEF
jgi:tRNA pseudouridine32 synthase/23S rRNA pseudouridine746 synthase